MAKSQREGLGKKGVLWKKSIVGRNQRIIPKKTIFFANTPLETSNIARNKILP